MKKVIFFLFASLLAISCSSDIEDPITPIDDEIEVGEGKQVFRVDLKELSAKKALSNEKNLEPAFALVSINDSNGAAILTREKIALTKKSDSYITNEISLEVGNYSLVEFIVTDANDVVISVAPKENSVLAQFSNSPLPFNFQVSENETKETAAENINAAGYTSIDFGYTGLTLTFPESTDSFSLTVDETDSITLKNLNLKSITGSTYLVDWGDEVIEEYVTTIPNSGIDNEISHTYSENGTYTITITGAIEAIEVFEFNSNQENNWESHITSVNIEKLTLLKSMGLFTGLLSSLDISKNAELEILNIGNHRLTSIDLSNNPNLRIITLSDNELTEVNVSQNPAIENLFLVRNQISFLDLSQNGSLSVISARENNLSDIDFSNNLNLTQFDLSNNAISSIDISANLALTNINLGANQLSAIDVSQNTNLVRLDLYTNQINAIDLSTNLKLRDLYIDGNLLTEIDLSSNPELERLIIENNNFTTLNITSNPKIFNLEIGGNQFSAMELDQILSQIYDHAILNSTMNGYVDYQNTPGFGDIDPTTIVKLNELVTSFNWTLNNN
ncbi:leucine-rich repeat domain-containing protein [Maribacter aestuarii]|uniref:leucine-rich repeat domain-containing protein n=1 Tax=Maribacter aestuarii TaxID=1130723 RepID=UPI00248C617C|nr:hypothetical protein [Maribacter aestuarii]